MTDTNRRILSSPGGSPITIYVMQDAYADVPEGEFLSHLWCRHGWSVRFGRDSGCGWGRNWVHTNIVVVIGERDVEVNPKI